MYPKLVTWMGDVDNEANRASSRALTNTFKSVQLHLDSQSATSTVSPLVQIAFFSMGVMSGYGT